MLNLSKETTYGELTFVSQRVLERGFGNSDRQAFEGKHCVFLRWWEESIDAAWGFAHCPIPSA
jgi:hypothetical protein